jgi:hypothetical protein
VTSSKRKRQYEHIKESARARGEGADRAEEIAARTVNKQRRQAGETNAQRGGARKRTAKSTRSRKSTGGASRSRAAKKR